MLSLLLNGNIFLFAALLFTIVFSLTLHEFGHAASANWLGDDTAKRMGRLTLSPLAHIDPIGLLMVMTIGFGYAKPVPTNPNLIKKSWGSAVVAAAGPFMNLLIAVVAINLSKILNTSNASDLVLLFSVVLKMLAQFNLLLMLFNLLPLGPLDGHWIMSWLLPSNMRAQYDYFNNRYGARLFLILILLNVMHVPIFDSLINFSERCLPYITFIR